MELTITNFNGIETIDSRLIAENIGKNHKELLRDIRTYCDYLDESNNGLVGERKIALTDFFIESTYTTSQNKVMPCYLCTRKGCEMIANKMTGAKGTVFTAMYINAFHSMENQLAQAEPIPDRDKTVDVELAKIQVEKARLLMEISNAETLSTDWKNIIISKAVETLTGENYLPMIESEKTYSAKEIGDMFGVSAQKIGRLATAYNLKVSEYGKWYKDKSQYSSKEVDTFRYNSKAIEKFKEIFN